MRQVLRTLREHKRRGLLPLALLAASLVAPPAAQAAVQQLPSSPLRVFVDDRGQLQGRFISDADGIFYNPSSNTGDAGFFLAFPDDPALPAGVRNTVWGFDGSAGPSGLNPYVPVANGPVTGSGTAADPYKNTTVYQVPFGAGGLVVTQVVTSVSGQNGFTTSWAVTNTSGGPAPYRAIFAADLYVAGDDFGIGSESAGPPRFVGGINPRVGRTGGVTEGLVPWTKYQETNFNVIWQKVQTANALSPFNNTINPNFVDNGVGVQWDDHCGPLCPATPAPGYRSRSRNRAALNEPPGAPLANGASAVYSSAPSATAPGGFALTPATASLRVGDRHTVHAGALNNAGQPYNGVPVRFSVAGANPKGGTVNTDAAGRASFGYVGGNPGADKVTAFLDFNGDGVRNGVEPQANATTLWVAAAATPPPDACTVAKTVLRTQKRSINRSLKSALKKAKSKGRKRRIKARAKVRKVRAENVKRKACGQKAKKLKKKKKKRRRRR